jgi:hypothetical protein
MEVRSEEGRLVDVLLVSSLCLFSFPSSSNEFRCPLFFFVQITTERTMSSAPLPTDACRWDAPLSEARVGYLTLIFTILLVCWTILKDFIVHIFPPRSSPGPRSDRGDDGDNGDNGDNGRDAEISGILSRMDV